MTDELREAIKTLLQLKGTPCYCGGKWGDHKKMVSGKPCIGERIDEVVAQLEQLIKDEKMPFQCPICGRYGCMNDHGYGGPGPED